MWLRCLPKVNSDCSAWWHMLWVWEVHLPQWWVAWMYFWHLRSCNSNPLVIRKMQDLWWVFPSKRRGKSVYLRHLRQFHINPWCYRQMRGLSWVFLCKWRAEAMHLGYMWSRNPIFRKRWQVCDLWRSFLPRCWESLMHLRDMRFHHLSSWYKRQMWTLWWVYSSKPRVNLMHIWNLWLLEEWDNSCNRQVSDLWRIFLSKRTW